MTKRIECKHKRIMKDYLLEQNKAGQYGDAVRDWNFVIEYECECCHDMFQRLEPMNENTIINFTIVDQVEIGLAKSINNISGIDVDYEGPICARLMQDCIIDGF